VSALHRSDGFSAYALTRSGGGLASAESVPEDVAAHCLRSAGVPLRVLRLVGESRRDGLRGIGVKGNGVTSSQLIPLKKSLIPIFEGIETPARIEIVNRRAF
jgi:hypothetical protein